MSGLDAIRAREAEFGRRVAALFGVDPAFVVNASAEEVRTADGVARRTVQVSLVRTVTEEEALRLRFGDDVEVIAKAGGGYEVRIPAPAPERSQHDDAPSLQTQIEGGAS